MRVLTVNAPGVLARELQRRAIASGGMKLMIADSANPLMPDAGSEQFVSFSARRKIDFSAIATLRRTIRDFKPDIIHSFLPRALSQTVLATLGMRKQPKIISFYGITRVPSWRDPADWITYLSPKVCMHSCESHAVKAALVQGGVKENKCEVIYNCVEKATPSSRRELLFAKYQIPENAFVVGTIATIRPVKGIDILLRALIECSHIPNLVAVIAGPMQDPKVASLVDDPRLQGRIRMLGYTQNAAEIMKGMDLFVMPSRKEGLCRALLEAMAQSVCPIVSNAGGMKELVRNGVDGVVFPSEDFRGLASAIQNLHADPETISMFGESAFMRVESMCAPHVVGERVIKMYQRLAA